MTDDSERRSLADQLRQEKPLDAAAARAAVAAVSLMNEAFEKSDLSSRRQLAEALGVSEGRISQILNGDGNVRVSTLARLLKASGFDLDLDLVGRPQRGRRTRRRRAEEPPTTYVTMKTVTSVATGEGGQGLFRHPVIELSTRHPSQERLETSTEWIGAIEFGLDRTEAEYRYIEDESPDAGASASEGAEERVH